MRRGFTPRELKLLRNEAEEQKEKMRGTQKWRNLDFILYIAIVVTLAFSIRAFLIEPIRVDGTSMVPTLLENELMLVEKTAYWFGEPVRGEIIICYYPGYLESCVKRVIGLPGETVSVVDGAVYINGEKLDESEYWNLSINGTFEGVKVGRDEVFVMGDNRNGSKDSRNSEVGCIPYSEIVGRVRAVIWPPVEIKRVDTVAYDGLGE